MPLTAVQRAHLELRLQEERKRALELVQGVVAEHGGTTERDDAGDLSSMPFHPADLGTDTMDDELAASNATRASRELDEIDEALERLYKTPEQFGRCENTGRDIPYERLELIPWARTCE